jgi:hypothetical protein
MNLKLGLLRLFEWTKDFKMHTQRNTHAQVWIRLLELPQEYWMDRTLREIASAVGTPLLIDNATTKRLFGHYARILVDMDLSRKIFHEIVVEREGFAFTLEVAYEWLPDFCTHCQAIGHDVSACRRLYPRKEEPAVKEKIAQGKKPIPVAKPNWVPIRDNPSGIGSSAAFGANNHDDAAASVPKQSMEVPVPIQVIENPAFEKEPDTVTLHKVAEKASAELAATVASDRIEETDILDTQEQITSMEQDMDASQQGDISISLQITLESTERAAL